MFIKAKIIFWLWKKRNIVLLNENVSSHHFSWYDGMPIATNLLRQITMQTHKARLKMEHLQQLLECW